MLCLSRLDASRFRVPFLFGLVTLGHCCAGAQPSGDARGGAGPKKLALLIGIHKYPDGTLEGCDADIHNMRQLLSASPFNSPPWVILGPVTDSKATASGIRAAIASLIAKATGPNDTILIYYAGHGTQLPDLDGDEEDNLDEAIVPYDAPTARKISELDLKRFILDDEIHRYLTAFKSPNVTFVFDSCHSGGASKGPANRPPQLGAARLEKFQWPAQLSAEALAARASASKNALRARQGDQELDVGEKAVFLGACQGWELSVGKPEGGVFTTALIAALRAQPGQPWSRVVNSVRANLLDRNIGQIPALTGATARTPFALREVRIPAHYARPSVVVEGAVDVVKGKTGLLKYPSGSSGQRHALVDPAGATFAGGKGTRLQVLPASISGARPHGVVQLTGECAPAQSDQNPECYATGAIISGRVQSGDRLIPMTVPLPQNTVVVGLSCDRGSDKVVHEIMQLNGLKERGFRLIRASKAPPQASAYDRCFDGNEMPDPDIMVTFAAAGGNIRANAWARIQQNALPQKFDAPAKDAADWFEGTLLHAVERSNQRSLLTRTHNPSPPFDLQLSLREDRVKVTAGESVAMQFRSDASVFYSVIICDDADPLTLVWQSDTVVPAGTTVPYTFNAPLSGHGYVAVKVIATTARLDLTLLNQSHWRDAPRILAAALRRTTESERLPAGFIGTQKWSDQTLTFSMP